jgi:hypothetical protein
MAPRPFAPVVRALSARSCRVLVLVLAVLALAAGADGAVPSGPQGSKPVPPVPPPPPLPRILAIERSRARVTDADPTLLTCIKRGLDSTNSSARLGYLELGAKLTEEIGPQTEVAGGVQVIMVGHGAEVMAAWRAEAARIAALPEATCEEP